MKGVYVKLAHYLISEAAHLADVEPHVLRYWEEELDLDIPRNELGHRYYTEQHIEMFKKIKVFKEKGYQLKAIRANLCGGQSQTPIIAGEDGGILYITPEGREECNSSDIVPSSRDDCREARMQEFKNIMTDIVAGAMAVNNEKLTKEVTKEVGDRIIKEINYIAREQEERAEERYRKFDENLRGCQKNSKAKAEAAAARELHKKNKKTARTRRHKNKAESIAVAPMY